MARADSTRGVFLIGFMGAGKTSVGRALAQRLGWPFQDLDDVIERREGKSVAGIFAEAGESGFRLIETQALRELLSAKEGDHGNWIVALGGGAFTLPENRAALQQAGALTVLLEAPLEELRRRVHQDGAGQCRPLALNEAEFARLFRERHHVYQLAKVRVDTLNKAVDQVAAEIEQVLAAVTQMEVRT
jgi:shikimate kinase